MPHPPPHDRRRGFTLTELLIVISILVLVTVLAVPAFNAMTGSRSTEAAQNQLSALLGQARVEAIGLQEPRGVLFFRDPATRRIGAVIVREVPVSRRPDAARYLDMDEGREPMLLPAGVELQVLDDQQPGVPPIDDRYIGYNTNTGVEQNRTRVPYGGVILFDGQGHLMSAPCRIFYGYKSDPDDDGPDKARVTTAARFFFNNPNIDPAGLPDPAGGSGTPSASTPTDEPALRSSIGLVLFDGPNFDDVYGGGAGRNADPDPDVEPGTNQDGKELTRYADKATSGSDPAREEEWIEQNAAAYLINRYNGTLIRAD